MKKIIEFCAISSEFPGSFIKCMELLLDKSMDKNMKINFVFPEEAKSTEWALNLSEKTTVYFIPSKKACLNIKTYVYIYNILKQENYEIIHSHYESYDICVFLISKFLKMKSKIIYHLHDCPLEHIKDFSFFRKLFYKAKYKLFTKEVLLIAINEKNKETISNYAKKAYSIDVLSNGINFKNLKYTNHLNYNIPTFITLGWDFYTKGDDIILKAAKCLYDKGYKFKLVINGNSETYKAISNFLLDKIPDYLEFQYPVVNRNDFFDKGSVFIQASRNETFSYGLCEATYMGKVVMCSDIPGMSWSFDLPNVNTFRSESVEELAALMEEYINDYKKFDFNKKYVRELIIKNFSDEVWTSKLISIYLDK